MGKVIAKHSIARVLILGYTFLCLFGMILSDFLILTNFTEQMREQTKNEAEIKLSYYINTLDGVLEELETNCNLILRNYDVQSAIRAGKAEDEIEVLKEHMKISNKIALLVQARALQDYNVSVLLDDGRYFFHGMKDYGFRRDAATYAADIYTEILEAEGTVYIYSRDPFTIRSVRDDWIIVGLPVINLQTNETCGIITCECSVSEIIESIGDIPDTITVKDGEQTVMSFGHQQMTRMSVYTARMRNGWTLDLCTAQKHGDYKRLMLELVTVFFAFIGTTLFMIYYLKKNITAPMSELIEHMKKIPLREESTESRIAEINELYDGYNTMKRHIDRLIDDTKKKEKEKRKAYYAALQVQIEPHFLYNSLDMIAWKIRFGQSDEAYSTLLDFARYYRLSLSMGKDLVPISSELERMGLYLKIMSARYMSQITYRIDSSGIRADERCCFRMLLQPVIENAIKHGILQKETQSGEIRISVYEKDCVIFEIWDDGVGFSEEELQKFRMNLENLNGEMIKKMERSGHGYGLYNISYRLGLLGDPRYHLEIESKSGEYTRVKILVPVLREEDRNEYES